MITLRHAAKRGRTKLDWLDSKHTFSFADYHDKEHMHFGPLRVINEDVVAPGQGFGAHSHSDMEIITYILEGELEHRDSLGTGSVIRRGEVQRMSAGTGVVHSEFNHSKTVPVHFLQIWVLPNKLGITAGYEQCKLDLAANSWTMVADEAGKGGAMSIHQDVKLLAGSISKDQRLSYSPSKGSAWIQVVTGSVTIGDVNAEAGDGVAIEAESAFDLIARADSEVLLFDLKAQAESG